MWSEEAGGWCNLGFLPAPCPHKHTHICSSLRPLLWSSLAHAILTFHPRPQRSGVRVDWGIAVSLALQGGKRRTRAAAAVWESDHGSLSLE